jgi:hypothetical protein
MKKISAFLLVVCIAVCSALTPIYAENNEPTIVTPYYLYAVSATSTLTISGSTATCTSELSGGSSVTRIVGTQYLQKKGILGIWSTVSSGTWSKSVDGLYLYMSNSKGSIDSGTYRLRTVFTVYSGNNSESIEKISSEATAY